jgi:hypothetical protein
MKSSRKGAVRAARLKLAVQAHSWIGRDWEYAKKRSPDTFRAKIRSQQWNSHCCALLFDEHLTNEILKNPLALENHGELLHRLFRSI